MKTVSCVSLWSRLQRLIAVPFAGGPWLRSAKTVKERRVFLCFLCGFWGCERLPQREGKQSVCGLYAGIDEGWSEGEGKVPDACSVGSWNEEEGGECRSEGEGEIRVFVCERV